jgi:hypothetical protein
MDELLGLIDVLEATILESKKIPMTNKLILEEPMLLQLVEKIRLSVKSGSSVVRQSVEQGDIEENVDTHHIKNNDDKEVSHDLLKKSVKESEEIKEGAQDYAEYILVNLHLMVTKMQKNLIKLEKNLESGRDILEKKQERENT